MKLSLHILERWFRSKGYHIQSSIHNSSPTLAGVRVENNFTGQTMVYIYMPRKEYGLVAVGNADGIIFVINSTTTKVFNEVNAAFDFYNYWESSLMQAVFNSQSLQELLDLAQLAIMRPVLIQNARYEIVAITDAYGSYTHPIWAQYFSRKDHTRPFRYWVSEGRFNTSSDLAMQTEPAINSSTLFRVNFILANLYLSDLRVGHIVSYEHGSPFSAADIHIMKVFQNIISFYIRADRSVLFPKTLIDDYMENILQADAPPFGAEKIAKIYETFEWSPEDSFIVTVIAGEKDTSPEELDALQNQISNDLQPVHITVHGRYIIVLVNLREYGGYSQYMDHLDQCGALKRFFRGNSQEFQDLNHLKLYYQIARITARCAIKCGRAGLSMQEAGPVLLMDRLEKNEKIDLLLHPQYFLLKQYDEENHTQLAATMFWYLFCSCSYAETASQMHTHRNTIFYRIAKANGLLGTSSFDHVGSRILYLLSYLHDHPECI